jgi:Leucine-rich repeat (LRR) protein
MAGIRKKACEFFLIGLACLAVSAPMVWIGHKKLEEKKQRIANQRAREKEEQDRLVYETFENARIRSEKMREQEENAWEKYPVIRKIRALKGTVSFDQTKPEWTVTKVSFVSFPTYDAPGSRIQVTDDVLADLRSLPDLHELDLGGLCLSDKQLLRYLADLPELTTLSLWENRISDAGLENLKGLKKLSTLHLGSNHITDAGLKHFKEMKQFQSISLSGNPITSQGLANLAGQARLEHLHLEGTQVGDEGLSYLKDLHNLKRLGLDNTAVTDVGLAHLESLAGLQFLSLNGTKMTDAGMVHLSKMSQLQFLSLNGTKVTAEGLKRLKPLDRLRAIEATGTKITSDEADSLMKFMPAVVVSAGKKEPMQGNMSPVGLGP